MHCARYSTAEIGRTNAPQPSFHQTFPRRPAGVSMGPPWGRHGVRMGLLASWRCRGCLVSANKENQESRKAMKAYRVLACPSCP